MIYSPFFMTQAAAGSLIFRDGPSERDFVAVSDQNSAMTGLHYEFRTTGTQYGSATQLETNVSSHSGSEHPSPVVLARIEWVARTVGSVKIFITRPPIEMPMASLCLPGSDSSSRFFYMDRRGDGSRSQFVWCRISASVYVLTDPSEAVMARYERSESPSPDGPNAVLQFHFNDKLLLLMALLSLTLNRWLDGPSSPLRAHST